MLNAAHQPSFTTEIHSKGSNEYVMAAHDFSHHLYCQLTLKVQKDGSVICHFPPIQGECIESPKDMPILTQFDRKILGQLLAFCTNHKASKLVVDMDSAVHTYNLTS